MIDIKALARLQWTTLNYTGLQNILHDYTRQVTLQDLEWQLPLQTLKQFYTQCKTKGLHKHANLPSLQQRNKFSQVVGVKLLLASQQSWSWSLAKWTISFWSKLWFLLAKILNENPQVSKNAQIFLTPDMLVLPNVFIHKHLVDALTQMLQAPIQRIFLYYKLIHLP